MPSSPPLAAAGLGAGRTEALARALGLKLLLLRVLLRLLLLLLIWCAQPCCLPLPEYKQEGSGWPVSEGGCMRHGRHHMHDTEGQAVMHVHDAGL